MMTHEQRRDGPNGLLVVVNSIGIPVLVREYGDVHAPPSAALGVISALFHAARNDTRDSELQWLQTSKRSICYQLKQSDLLLVFASDKPNSSQRNVSASVNALLRLVFATIELAAGEGVLASTDASKLRSTIAKVLDVIDYIVINHRRDARLVLQRPGCCVGRSIGLGKAVKAGELSSRGIRCAFAISQDGTIVEEAITSKSDRISAECALILTFLARAHEATVFDQMIFVQLGNSVVPQRVLIRSTTQRSLRLVLVLDENSPVDDGLLDTILQQVIDTSFACDSTYWTAVPSSIDTTLPASFICAISARPGSPSPSCRLLSLLRPTWRKLIVAKANVVEVDHGRVGSAPKDEHGLWRMLSGFIASRIEAASDHLSDCKVSDELLTFVHSTRGPIHAYSVFVGAIPITKVCALGDIVCRAFLVHSNTPAAA
ncbi:TPA: hypothetical protein N0F65_008496 [Lagenidium giganteum]|uniref:Vacuolar fusion protein MON1 n=1 Tax=Lagenidium giganteum TaxID=4803 RepID=A0AAV2Z0I6_9STRA|nr:TPA: hypothetical protein N0F65_008496 [Lagenidium giganteum]